MNNDLDPGNVTWTTGPAVAPSTPTSAAPPPVDASNLDPNNVNWDAPKTAPSTTAPSTAPTSSDAAYDAAAAAAKKVGADAPKKFTREDVGAKLSTGPMTYDMSQELTGIPSDNTPTPNLSANLAEGVKNLKSVPGMLAYGLDATSAATPFMNRVDALGDATINLLRNGKFNYNDMLDMVNKQNEYEKSVAPETWNTIGPAGSMAATAPLFGGKAAALTDASWLMKLLNIPKGALGGAITGVSNSSNLANPSEDASEAGKGALVGSILGTIPAVASGAGNFYKWFANKAANANIPGVTAPVRDALVGATNGKTDAELTQRLSELGPSASIADLGPEYRSQAGDLAKTTGNPQTTIENAFEPRNSNEQRTTRLGQDVTNALGPYDATRNEGIEALIAQKADIGRTQFTPALQATPTVTPDKIQPILDRIDSALPNAGKDEAYALNQIKKSLIDQPGQPAIPGTPAQRTPVPGTKGLFQNTPAVPDTPATPAVPKTNTTALNNAKLDGQNLVRYGNAADGVMPIRGESNVKSILADLNQTLKDNVPGYGDAMDAYSSINKQKDALEYGVNYGKQNPTDFETKFNTMPPEEQQAVRMGMRYSINDKLGRSRNDLGALDTIMQGEQGNNTSKISTAFSPNAADTIHNGINREKTFAEMNPILKNAKISRGDAAATALREAMGNPKPLLNEGHSNESMFGTFVSSPFKKAVNQTHEYMTPKQDPDFMAQKFAGQGPQAQQFLADILRTRPVLSQNADRAKNLAKGLAFMGGSATVPALSNSDSIVNNLVNYAAALRNGQQ